MSELDEITAELIAACRKHLTPSEAIFVRACLINYPDQMRLHLNTRLHGSYSELGAARLALRCAEQVAGGLKN